MWPLVAIGVVTLSLQVSVSDVGGVSTPGLRSTPQVAVNAAPPGTPVEAVALLYLPQLGSRVAVPLSAGPYVRGAFGRGWSDADGDGCSTRDEVLSRWVAPDLPRGSCRVSGETVDPYTGQRTRLASMEPDHVVPLAEAWVAGAWAWSASQRESFANDAGNLVPTSRWLVRSAGERVGGGWRPPNEWYRCTYVSAYVGTKYLYNLTVTSREAAGLAADLESCGGPWVTRGS